MTVAMYDYHGHRIELSNEDGIQAAFAEQAETILPHGGSGQTIWLGPDNGDPILRVDIDIDVDRAALSWLPDGSHGVEQQPTEPITVLESADSGLITIPAELARVSAATTQRAVIEYVTTGQKPTCVRWEPVPATTAA
jgi:Immunity protein Imm1